MLGYLKNKYLWLLVLVISGISMVSVFADSNKDIPPPKQKYSEETLCVEPVEIMRKQHFEYLLTHRDETVIEGIRTKKHSLKGCIDCHITANAQGEYARYAEDTHFCANCHQFAAVTIDCFQCHADRPEQAIRKTMNPNQTVDHSDQQKIHQYLELSHSATQ
jgi:hypothetical protein